MNSSLTAIAVLASLLFICCNSGSANWLYNDCGGEYQGAVGPWTALLQQNGEIFCAGTLITKFFILTAANCIKTKGVVKVRLGEFGRSEGDLAEDHLVDYSLRYRYYNNESYSNNIGLLKLTKEVQFKAYIKPICIIGDPKQEVKNFIGTAWQGMNIDGMYSTMELGSIRIERKPHLCDGLDLYTQFCAGSSEYSQSCDGLSGSALSQYLRYQNENRIVQFGISTLSEMDCQGVQGYTDVTKFYWWIQDVIALFEVSSYTPKRSFAASATSKRIYTK
ncbi:coagulation factor X [Drosophila subpulchrella]|uniref:coagulation factor X n=1 Tax=Drosophila subpulchrella TaxID=1486046 RepID=UPI0018A13CCD|nr:coagulation factor X [Drosophila subpulchrella]